MERSPGGSLAQTLTYNTLIKGLGRELRVDEAFGVARGMVDRGCFPNEVSYRCCFTAAADTVEAAALTQPHAAWVGDEMACLHQGVCLSVGVAVQRHVGVGFARKAGFAGRRLCPVVE